jgi:signal transduction histidine kinase/ActR/RegA family two-component response regulator
MECLPAPIAAYLCSEMIGKRTVAYLILDGRGMVCDGGGDLDRFGVDMTGTGWDVTNRLVFMVGLLPLDESSLKLQAIRLGPDMTIDAHLLKTDAGYSLLLVDSTKEGRAKKKVQQKANEQSLLREKKRGSGMNETSLKDILSALNVSAMERSSHGGFVPIGNSPEWMAQFKETLDLSGSSSDVENALSFLGNFLIEAVEFWDKQISGCVRSGIWIEGDAAGDKYMFEAFALTSFERQILLVARDQKFYKDQQTLIQKGRQLALDYQTLSKLEDELRRSKSELETRVKARTEELEEANRRLAEELAERKRLEEERKKIERQLLHSQKMEAIGTLAGGIAHDFNNILSAIVGFTELSLMCSDPQPKLKDNLEKTLRASFRAKDLIRQILTFSREAKEEPKPIQIKTVVSETLEFFRASFPTTIDIKRDLKSDGTVFADPSQIHQLIMNLCTNAGHAMEETGGGTLSVVLRDVVLDSMKDPNDPMLPMGDYIKLSIQDTGCGMAMETVDKIFNPFFTTRKNGKGTGLGLSVVHGIVRRCKGAVTVESAPGKGSTFHVFLPNYEIYSAKKGAAPEIIPQGGERILVVDDDPVQMEIAGQQLKMLGYAVSTFTDSSEALQHFREQPENYDLVITDQTMPKISGTVLAEEMLQIRPELPIIICTGFGDNVFEEKVHAMGIRGCLMKPLSIHELATAIRKYLERPEANMG